MFLLKEKFNIEALQTVFLKKGTQYTLITSNEMIYKSTYYLRTKKFYESLHSLMLFNFPP